MTQGREWGDGWGGTACEGMRDYQSAKKIYIHIVFHYMRYKGMLWQAYNPSHSQGKYYILYGFLTR